jgi:1-acyl-sn-glycerol-3-phosphate acyltransferase
MQSPASWLTPMLGRQMHILAKQALFVGPLGWILRKLGATPVKAGGSDIEAYRVARAVLDRGDVLCIFPEGTRSPLASWSEPAGRGHACDPEWCPSRPSAFRQRLVPGPRKAASLRGAHPPTYRQAFHADAWTQACRDCRR